MNSTDIVTKRKINRPFYPLVKEELLWLRSQKLINNTAFIYLALRLENPHCDRPIKIETKEFTLAWGIPESSFYRAVADLKETKCLSFKNKTVVIQWEQGFDIWNVSHSKSQDSQQATLSDNLDSQQGGDSRNLEFSLGSENLLSDPRENSQILEKPKPEALPDKGSGSLQTIQNIQTSSDQSEEENKFKEKKEGCQEEINFGVNSEPHSLAALERSAEPVTRDEYLDREEYSAAAPSPKTENLSLLTEDAEILEWLVRTKIPTLNLSDPPRNLEAYARGMIRRDGDVLRREFAEVVSDRLHQTNCAIATKLVQDRAIAWKAVGIEVTVFNKPDGGPAVMLEGTEITGSDFLNKPIDQTPSAAIATFAGTEIMENRSYRQIRLKTASAVGESPGLEFLIESWGDVLLRSQIKQLIEKYSFWGIFINEQNQLEQLESAATLQRPSQAEKPCDETADFPLTVDLHHESPEYQKLKFPTADDFTEYVVKVDPQDFTDPSEWSATGDRQEEDIDPCDEEDIEF